MLMCVKLQLVMCDNDGHEATVTEVVTLKKEAHALSIWA
jgi:hypothetical protein